MIGRIALAAAEALVPRTAVARRDYDPLPQRPTVGPGVPLRDPQAEPDDEPYEATPQERRRWAEGDRTCRKAFGVPDREPSR